MAVSGPDELELTSTEVLELSGVKFEMKFEIFGEQTVTDTFVINMTPCTDYSMFNLGEDNSRNPRSEALI